MNNIETDEDRQWLKRLVRVLIKEPRTWKQKKASLKRFRQNHIDRTGCSEKDADSTIEGALADYSCKIRKRMTIKKPG